MNSIRLAAVAVLFIVVASIAQATTGQRTDVRNKTLRTDTISVPEMQCGSCEMKLSKALGSLAGVTEVAADAEANTVIVTYDPAKISRAALVKKIAATGYAAGDRPANAAAQKALPKCCQPGGH